MERLILTPRLTCIADLVPPQARLADVGTDHGKLPIWLLKEKRIDFAIGTDIRKGPLDHAARNAADHGVALPLRLSPGLEAVAPEECDTVSIAGMGGQTIAEILQAALWTADGAHLLLLQPMTMAAELRQWLWAHGYELIQETLCREERRWYVVISARGGAEPKTFPLSRCYVSRALCRDKQARGYLEQLLSRETRALAGMERGKTPEAGLLQTQRDTVAAITQALEEWI